MEAIRGLVIDHDGSMEAGKWRKAYHCLPAMTEQHGVMVLSVTAPLESTYQHSSSTPPFPHQQLISSIVLCGAVSVEQLAARQTLLRGRLGVSLGASLALLGQRMRLFKSPIDL